MWLEFPLEWWFMCNWVLVIEYWLESIICNVQLRLPLPINICARRHLYLLFKDILLFLDASSSHLLVYGVFRLLPYKFYLYKYSALYCTVYTVQCTVYIIMQFNKTSIYRFQTRCRVPFSIRIWPWGPSIISIQNLATLLLSRLLVAFSRNMNTDLW